MKYTIQNLEELLNAMSIHVPENLIEEVENNISKLKIGNKKFKGIEDAYDYLLDNINNEKVVKLFVSAGILKIDPITPLFHSLLLDEIDISKYLISQGANLEGAIILLRNELQLSEIKEIIKKMN